MEFMQQDLRLSKTSRKEVNTTKVDGTDETVNEKQGMINAPKQKMRENQIVEGLSIVSQAISTGNSKRNDDQHIRNHCWYHGVDNNLIHDCLGFKALDDKGTFESVRKSGACFDCMEHKTCDVVGTNGQMSGRYHHPILHLIHVLSLYNSNIDSNRVLLMIS